MTKPVIKLAAPADALLVAALTLQAARDQNAPHEPRFLDRFADEWKLRRDQSPIWFAEYAGRHAGIVHGSRVRALPWPGREDSSALIVQLLFVPSESRDQGIEAALLAGVRDWARRRSITEITAGSRLAAEHRDLIDPAPSFPV
ncbi:GNAT family N-acetyltransferase [Granulicoccus phenolivorans]|uniref:GNAT family N-acetyltransferase n=1 Tax=Granulicoccus phenolivorans TaxID=266854 RepID=UPI000428DA29|nr:GNAT family N-acetyltransferase [Granulicoccus phenolivorans]